MDATGNSVVSETSNAFTDPAGGEPAAEAGLSGAVPAEDAEDETAVEDGRSAGLADDEAEASPEPAGEAVDGVALARDLLDQIMQAMGVEATVGAQRQGDGSVRLLVEGHDMGVVIGKHGSTINALQYLVGLILQKRTGERTRLVIDAEGYRNRREQALKEMALTYAQRVKETGNEAVLDALQSYERRIIHNSLADDPHVFTYSEGEEPDRRVVISPRETEEAEGMRK
jgi:spoIIIJ-associated protein